MYKRFSCIKCEILAILNKITWEAETRTVTDVRDFQPVWKVVTLYCSGKVTVHKLLILCVFE